MKGSVIAALSPIFTVGHSTQKIESLLAMLEANGVSAVADVRSVPKSAFNPQFNRPALRSALRQRGFEYVFLGEQLGARTEDPTCYVGDRVSYERLSQTTSFREGMRRLVRGRERFSLAIMCAEADPIDCHRAILISPLLEAAGMSVAHIRLDGSIETQRGMLDRLRGRFNLLEESLFETPEDLDQDALARQERKIAYVRAKEDAR